MKKRLLHTSSIQLPANGKTVEILEEAMKAAFASHRNIRRLVVFKVEVDKYGQKLYETANTPAAENYHINDYDAKTASRVFEGAVRVFASLDSQYYPVSSTK